MRENKEECNIYKEGERERIRIPNSGCPTSAHLLTTSYSVHVPHSSLSLCP
ncbi:hypothetical protein HanIR_Chr15g0762071 [Helianthus annuus]|nr:hypothetical protein HanIR_Chr15g0762071 [Helianthus annuus]